MLFVTPSPLSAKADAHWLIESSLAPAHSIIAARIQKILAENSPLMLMLSPFSVRVFIGTRIKQKAFTAGITAHMQDIIRQLSLPNKAKKAVEIRITAAEPQQ